MDEDVFAILQHEFSARKDSFLLQLRVHLHWDKEAFDLLTSAMRKCCEYYEQEQLKKKQDLEPQEILLPRWLARGFWYLPRFVRHQTSHPAWNKRVALEPEYFKKAYERLDALAFWFFTGARPWEDIEKGWTVLQEGK